MTVSVQDVRRLRRMVNEADDVNYSDDDLRNYIANYPAVDRLGRVQGHAHWSEAYDLHGAAADIWEEKAAKLANQHDFSADGSSFSANQMYENAMKQARHHRASQKARPVRVGSTLPPTYYPHYRNPVFDEDEIPDWVDYL